MKKRQIIIVIVAALILLLGKLSMNYMATPPEKERPEDKVRIVTVFTEKVSLRDIPVQVETTGSLQAKNRMELYSEVQGLMLPDQGRFKSGTTFKKGQPLVRLRSDDARSRVVSQRSSFQRLLSSVMADIRIDYESQYGEWSTYLRSIDAEAPLPPLPAIHDEQLKSYLTGRNIYTEFYTVRNLEIGLSRYRIVAPFSGVLTSANVTPGTVVRPGQLLGVFVKPGLYEMQAASNSNNVDRLAKGQKVELFKDDSGIGYEGSVSRINASVDAQTQMSSFFIEVRSDELKEGQFLRLAIQAETINEAFEIDRSAIKDSRTVFVVVGDELRSVPIEIVYTKDKTAIIKGLKEGQEVLVKLPPSAFDGMKVSIYSDTVAP